MTVWDLKQSAETDPEPPAGLSPELRALWFAKANRWDEAHRIAQDIDTPEGSWIHALLHLIEGDIGNARYWFVRAGRSPVGVADIDREWERVAARLLADSD